MKDLPRAEVPVGAKLAAKNRLANVPLDLKDDRTTLWFTTELEDKPGIWFRSDDQVQLRHGLNRRVFVSSKLYPPRLENKGLRLRPF